MIARFAAPTCGAEFPSITLAEARATGLTKIKRGRRPRAGCRSRTAGPLPPAAFVPSCALRCRLPVRGATAHDQTDRFGRVCVRLRPCRCLTESGQGLDERARPKRDDNPTASKHALPPQAARTCGDVRLVYASTTVDAQRFDARLRAESEVTRLHWALG